MCPVAIYLHFHSVQLQPAWRNPEQKEAEAATEGTENSPHQVVLCLTTCSERQKGSQAGGILYYIPLHTAIGRDSGSL